MEIGTGKTQGTGESQVDEQKSPAGDTGREPGAASCEADLATVKRDAGQSSGQTGQTGQAGLTEQTGPAAVIPRNGTPDPLTRAPLAYENPGFLNSADGRLIRIVAEYCEPLARFRREQIQDTVVFFGSARFHGREEADHALELLDNTGSTQPAPSHEQPAKAPEIAAGKATELQRKRAVAAVEMARYYEDARRLAHMLTNWAIS